MKQENLAVSISHPKILDVVFQHCMDAIVLANDKFEVIAVNEAAQKLFQACPEVLMHPVPVASIQLFEPDQKTLVAAADLPLRQVINGEKICDREYFLETANAHQGTWLSVSGFAVGNIDGFAFRGAVIIRDITQRRQKELENLNSYLKDSLTGMLTRSQFIDRVDHALAWAQRHGPCSMALVRIDVDHFHEINDIFGHAIGDRTLIEIARRLRIALGSSCPIARLRGDGFAALFERIASHGDIVQRIQGIQDEFSAPFQLDNHRIQIDLNLGIAIGPERYFHPEDLLRDAAIAMGQAKDSSDSSYCFFNNRIDLDSDENFQIAASLRQAIENNELTVYYQPIVSIYSRMPIGCEALVRWNHPDKGLLSPAAFIPVAEKTGLIIPLGWWVLTAACQQVQTWRQNGSVDSSFFVSVNMSSQQFSQKYIAEKIQEILESTGLEGKNLKLELTEGVLINHSQSIVSKLEQIRAMGIKLAIDDFGTGYSSLSYLHRFPFDSLKLDRSFIEDADSDYEKLEILQSVVRLAWNLGLEVVAEGVETPKHFAQLKALRCECGQGYLFSRPLDAQAAETFILQHKE